MFYVASNVNHLSNEDLQSLIAPINAKVHQSLSTGSFGLDLLNLKYPFVVMLILRVVGLK